jgi:hypothetical protein
MRQNSRKTGRIIFQEVPDIACCLPLIAGLTGDAEGDRVKTVTTATSNRTPSTMLQRSLGLHLAADRFVRNPCLSASAAFSAGD